ncbi:MAG: PAS domain-containing protein [Clostridia bacterium]|nr:PAS domain-containing protein [Clostridia bacterium]
MLPDHMMEWINYILTNMEDAVLLTGSNGKVLFANPAADKLFGLEVRGRDRLWDAIPYVEENDAFIQLFIDGGMERKKSFQSLVDYVNREGEHFNLHVTLTCQSDNDNMALIVIHDLTNLIKVHSAFERYTSPEIADYVLTAPDGEKQGGREAEVSVLMSDLRGFTAMSTRIPSERLITMLNHYFEVMAAVIKKYQGTVIEFLGDGLFVVFGAPQSMPEHAKAAVSCALEMLNAMADVNTWNHEHGFPDLEMGIGINSGPAVVGNIGSAHKMKYGCMGETVNMAGRLEGLSLGGEVCITECTRKKIPAGVKILKESSFMPKGGKEEMKFYVIAGISGGITLSGACEEKRWRTLPAEKELVFYMLNGKTVDPEPHAGKLTRVTEDEKFGMLTTESILQPMQNLMLRINDKEAYAKVTDCGTDGFMIGFTMKPEDFSGLLS